MLSFFPRDVLDEILNLIKLVSEGFPTLPSSTYPNYIGFPQEESSYQLVAFCDASKYAYAATIYLRQELGSLCRTDLVFSKTRLAPNKEISIPRLELLAAFIGTNCLKFVETELKLEIAQKLMWVDSQCVLYWLDSNKPLSICIENRVNEIKELNNICFHYISTKENPADMASRGTSTSVALLFYVHGKHLRSCWDGQLT